MTPAVVRELLGPGAALPPAVRAAIARERRRLGASSDGDGTSTNNWIECLEQLPWTRRAEAPIDLAQVRAALDAGHAGLERVKACILEHLAVRRRNPRIPAVLCLASAPGVGKTSLARCVADTLGRGFVKLGRVEGRRVAGRASVADPALSHRAAIRGPWARFLPPLSEPGVPISGTGLSSGIMRLAHGLPGRGERSGVASRGTAARTLAPAGRWVVRPVDALTTATARVVPFAWACDDVRHCCSSPGY